MNGQSRFTQPFFLVLTLMGVAILLPAFVDAQQLQLRNSIEHGPGQTEPVEPGNHALSSPNQMINEILEIRKQLGGGVAEHLHGLEIGETDGGRQLTADHVFNQELDRIASLGRPANNRPNADPDKMVRNQLDRLAEHNSTQPPVTTATFALGSPAAFGGHSTATGELRRAARQLETVAADLEEVKLFQEADDLRDRARVFWRKARETDHHAP